MRFTFYKFQTTKTKSRTRQSGPIVLTLACFLRKFQFRFRTGTRFASGNSTADCWTSLIWIRSRTRILKNVQGSLYRKGITYSQFSRKWGPLFLCKMFWPDGTSGVNLIDDVWTSAVGFRIGQVLPEDLWWNDFDLLYSIRTNRRPAYVKWSNQHHRRR